MQNSAPWPAILNLLALLNGPCLRKGFDSCRIKPQNHLRAGSGASDDTGQRRGHYNRGPPHSVLAKEAVPHPRDCITCLSAKCARWHTPGLTGLRSIRSKAAELDVEDRLPIILDGLTGSGLTHEFLQERLISGTSRR
jgi:hypothetical protein